MEPVHILLIKSTRKDFTSQCNCIKSAERPAIDRRFFEARGAVQLTKIAVICYNPIQNFLLIEIF